jgi:predicted kinase
MSEKLVDIEDIRVLHETEKAYRIDNGTIVFWIPKSQCELSDDRKTLTLPEWLAIEKELV